jgi:cell division protein FtsW (lipid II flippase)
MSADRLRAVADAGPPVVRRKGRGTEIVLLLLALGVTAGTFIATSLAILDEIPGEIFLYLALYSGMAAALHVVVRLWAPYADPIMLPTVVCLNGMGLGMIYRLDLADSVDTSAASGQVFGQLLWALGGGVLFAAVLILLVDHRMAARYTYVGFLVGIGLLLLPLVPGLGVEINGARIWINVFGYSFQPGEAAKIVLVVSFSSYLVVHRDALALVGRRILGIDLPRGRDLGPLLAMWAVALAILFFETDLGAAVMIFGIFVVLLWVATERIGWLVVGGLLTVVGGLSAYVLFDHVKVRVSAWLDPFADLDANFQIVQSMYGLAHGGILGTGLGQGNPDLIPFAESDFIVAAFGEEIGLTGLMAMLLLYGLLVERGIRTALLTRDSFGTLLAAGLSTAIAIQVFVIVGGVTKLIPLTGLTTPFLSLGGSSLVMNWLLVGILMRVSDMARQPPLPEPGPLDDATTQAVRIR